MEIVLNTYGTALTCDNEGFCIISDGKRQRIPTTYITGIQISKGAQITSDAVLLAIEAEIPVIFTDKSGKPIGRIWSPRYGSISTIRKGQLNFTSSHKAVAWIKEILCKKIENQQALILLMLPDENTNVSRIDKQIKQLDELKNNINQIDGERVADIASSLRGWEGIASKIYFESLNSYLPEHLQFAQRTQHPAHDAMNAFLNYGYGLLYGKIEGALIKTGIDPYIGVLHRDNYNRPVLVYDVIEIYRIWVDYIVYSLALQNTITDDLYSVRDDGSFWLESLGRRILIQSLNDYLDEVTEQNNIARSRETQIALYAQQLAQQFKRCE